jgi:hypothetical protein
MDFKDEVRKLLNYNSDTGIFTWKTDVSNKKKGSVAGTLHHHGYIQIAINKKFYPAHRLAWVYVYGEMPKKYIDHINGIRDDNRIANLREATHFQNLQNMKISCRNKSGHKGVEWHKAVGKWRVRCQANGKRIELGHFDNLELAALVSIEARAKYHKEFARDE